MIEARASRVPKTNGRTAVFGKGETAEGFRLPVRAGEFWDDAEDAAYCHETWSAISVLIFTLFISIFSHHKCVFRQTVICGVSAFGASRYFGKYAKAGPHRPQRKGD